jgi:hypothetical protein
LDSLLRFLDHYEILFYVIAAIIIIIAAQRTYLAWREWSASLFGLEKENSQRKFNQGLTILVFCVLVAAGIFFVNTFVTPTVPGVQQLATPTIDVTQIPPTSTAAPTSEQTGQGFIPTITAYLSRGCVPGQVDWTDPQNEDTISGIVELKGTVNIEDLGFYKYEFSPSGTDSWTTIAAGKAIIQNDLLGGAWDTSDLVPGNYELRLVVYDNLNNPLPACLIQVTIEAAE